MALAAGILVLPRALASVADGADADVSYPLGGPRG
jgi:hypothetical protein